jgi:hypothetical protein
MYQVGNIIAIASGARCEWLGADFGCVVRYSNRLDGRRMPAALVSPKGIGLYASGLSPMRSEEAPIWFSDDPNVAILRLRRSLGFRATVGRLWDMVVGR